MKLRLKFPVSSWEAHVSRIFRHGLMIGLLGLPGAGLCCIEQVKDVVLDWAFSERFWSSSCSYVVSFRAWPQSTMPGESLKMACWGSRCWASPKKLKLKMKSISRESSTHRPGALAGDIIVSKQIWPSPCVWVTPLSNSDNRHKHRRLLLAIGASHTPCFRRSFWNSQWCLDGKLNGTR